MLVIVYQRVNVGMSLISPQYNISPNTKESSKKKLTN